MAFIDYLERREQRSLKQKFVERLVRFFIFWIVIMLILIWQNTRTNNIKEVAEEAKKKEFLLSSNSIFEEHISTSAVKPEKHIENEAIHGNKISPGSINGTRIRGGVITKSHFHEDTILELQYQKVACNDEKIASKVVVIKEVDDPLIVELSSKAEDPKVIGVIVKKSEGEEYFIQTSGIAECYVTTKEEINVGDLLTTGENGCASKLSKSNTQGCILGKALQHVPANSVQKLTTILISIK